MGILTMSYYDVTEYECFDPGNRLCYAPPLLAAHLDQSLLAHPETISLYTASPLATWMDAKSSVALPFIIIWFLYRLAYFISFQLIDLQAYASGTLDRGNVTCRAFEDTLTASWSGQLNVSFLIVVSIIGLMIDARDLYIRRVRPGWLRYFGTRKRSRVSSWFFYRLLQMLLNIGVLMLTISYVIYRVSGSTLPLSTGQFVYIATMAGYIWSLLYFFQLIPHHGHYVVAIQHMMKDFCHFAALFLMFFIPFALSFQKVINENIHGECPEAFASVADALYTVFMTILNMVDFRKYLLDHGYIIYLLHTGFVLIIALLMINFMIAIFSNTYTAMSNHSALITAIQKFSLIWLVEMRLPRCLTRFQTCLKKHYFLYENGRILLTYVRYSLPEQSQNRCEK